ncbi:hypothetical protein PUNSTDRAFT_82821 [Punctularia strigosozonata HHB-11173 SS5]|uniref:uncharacterized protein n=1 Tax=Punctularia strigosozonata (strain HHB-11173) TaxID=741275 RepID=UPI0004416C3D|nr:uncharacterized protein PUNSTDRAFT_82821 [Punctularia strigosozonata HHB-11173 SS5]EIN11253.1 hypothetical protein PUNSTDRAFT_82821 [Punctularia strigosozonata HHB-11173 SS5]
MDVMLLAVGFEHELKYANAACRSYLQRYGLCGNDHAATSELLARGLRMVELTFGRALPFQDWPAYRAARGEVVEEHLLDCEVVATGARRILRIAATPLRDAHGTLMGGLARFLDVTDFERAVGREIAAKGEQYFQLVCESIPQIMWTARPDGFHDWFNQTWWKFTGASVESSMGVGWRSMFHPEDMAEANKVWSHSLRTGEPYNVQYRCRRRDGVWRWMLGTARPLRDGSGEIVKWFGSCTDINDTVEALYGARRSQAHLSSVITHAAITLWAVDKNGVITVAEGDGAKRLKLVQTSPADSAEQSPTQQPAHLDGGPRARAKPGRTHSPTLVGKSIYDVWKPETKEYIARALGGETVVKEMEMDGRWFRTSYTPMRERSMLFPSGYSELTEEEEEITGVVGASMDITAQKEAEKMMEESAREKMRALSAETAAKEASRLKSEFLANMSHEIRTPIAGVIGMSELLCSTPLTQEQREYAENIQRSADALLQVINDILDFSKVEIGKLDIENAPFRLDMVIEDTVKMLGFATRKKGLTFGEDVKLEHAEWVMGDAGRVRQVITNLLTNAIKFTSEGSIGLAALEENVSEEVVQVKVVVTDTGCGIPAAHLGRLFRPFSQGDTSTARRFGGTGLGLTISKNLVELMGGRIGLESEEGVGSTAWFSIPFKRTKPPPAGMPQTHEEVCGRPYSPRDSIATLLEGSPRSSPRSSPGLDVLSSVGSVARRPRSSVWVLVAEDNLMNQKIALQMLQKMGFNALAANNGQEALTELTRKSYDLVLMDCQMPEMDGYEATTRLRSMPQTMHIPVIAMTASAIRGDREKCLDKGMSDYLSKPVKSRVLEEMILKWLPDVAELPSPPPGTPLPPARSPERRRSREIRDRPATGISPPSPARAGPATRRSLESNASSRVPTSPLASTSTSLSTNGSMSSTSQSQAWATAPSGASSFSSVASQPQSGGRKSLDGARAPASPKSPTVRLKPLPDAAPVQLPAVAQPPVPTPGVLGLGISSSPSPALGAEPPRPAEERLPSKSPPSGFRNLLKKKTSPAVEGSGGKSSDAQHHGRSLSDTLAAHSRRERRMLKK